MEDYKKQFIEFMVDSQVFFIYYVYNKIIKRHETAKPT